MTYLVNGEEHSTKKAATDAMFKAVEKGEVVLALAPVVEEPVATEVPDSAGLAGGVPVEL